MIKKRGPGRPRGSKNKPKTVVLVKKAAQPKKDNLSPWLNEVSDLNQEVNALRRQLSDANVLIKYLEYQLGLKHYENPSI